MSLSISHDGIEWANHPSRKSRMWFPERALTFNIVEIQVIKEARYLHRRSDLWPIEISQINDKKASVTFEK